MVLGIKPRVFACKAYVPVLQATSPVFVLYKACYKEIFIHGSHFIWAGEAIRNSVSGLVQAILYKL